MTGMLIVADDLSGAAETAGAVTAVTGGVADLRLGVQDGGADPLGVRVIDTDSRTMTPREAADATVRAVRSADPGVLVYKKVDSMLRGNIAAEVSALAAERFRMIAALAVPRVGRTVLGGAVRWDGAASASIPDALGVPSSVLGLDVVRSPGLADAVLSAWDDGLLPVLDGESEADLHRIASVVAQLPGVPVVLAAGGLARSLAPLLAVRSSPGRFVHGADRVVVVAGTRAASAARQVDALVVRGLRHIVLRPGDPPRLGDGDAVVTLDDTAAWDREALTAALGAVGAAVASMDGRTDLVLTGGDTARRVLDSRGVTRLQVEFEIEDGAVLSTIDSGAAVVTRPGNFGDDGGLVRILAHLKGDLA